MFCRADKVLRLAVKTDFNFTSAEVKDLVSTPVTVFGASVEEAGLTTKSEGGKLTIELKLPSPAKFENTHGISASGPWRPLFYHDIPIKNLSVFARVLARNCI
jgi:hypothetical protein